jgi:hypothetical protein
MAYPSSVWLSAAHELVGCKFRFLLRSAASLVKSFSNFSTRISRFEVSIAQLKVHERRQTGGNLLLSSPDSAQFGGLVGIGVKVAQPARGCGSPAGLPLFVRPWQRESGFLVVMF